MEKNILNFHFDYLHPSLIFITCHHKDNFRAARGPTFFGDFLKIRVQTKKYAVIISLQIFIVGFDTLNLIDHVWVLTWDSNCNSRKIFTFTFNAKDILCDIYSVDETVIEKGS